MTAHTHSPGWTLRQRLAAGVLLTAFLGLGGLWVFRVLRPADRVRVTVENVDPDTRFLCLVVEQLGGAKPLRWSRTWGIPFAVHPGHSELSFRRGGPCRVDVAWQSGRRYGVLTCDREGTWRLWWFPAAEVRPQDRGWLVGGGEAHVELPGNERAVTPTRRLLRRLGVAGVERRVRETKE